MTTNWREVPFDDVDDATFGAWAEIRRSAPALRGPFFDPEFARVVHRTVRPVTLLVEQEGRGEVRSLWPVHRHGSRVIPVGSPAADFQGPISLAPVDPMRMLAEVGARTLAFDHLAEDPGVPTRDVRVWRTSPYLDVAGGMSGYLTRASRSGRDNLSQARRRARKATEAFGELRFSADTTSVTLLEALIRLKRQQYAATGSADFFAEKNHRRLLEHLLRSRHEDFSGVLSAVHCGDTLLAAHFGLRAGGVLHWWFPVYAPDLARFSPGWILLRELVTAAPELGVDRIDLGRGEDEYKRRAKTGEVRVGAGTVSTSRTAQLAHSMNDVARGVVRRTGVAPRIRKVLKPGGRE